MPATLDAISRRLEHGRRHATDTDTDTAHPLQPSGIAERLDLLGAPGRTPGKEAFLWVMADDSERAIPQDQASSLQSPGPHLRLAGESRSEAPATIAPVAPTAPSSTVSPVSPEPPAPAPLDERIARALEQMRARPAERWTVARLAKAAGLSRAAFARRFAAEVGVPPLRYLADLRLARAAQRLVESNESLAGVAAEIGYESEFAFSRAFKRRYGEAPGVWRRHARIAGGRPMAPRAAA